MSDVVVVAHSASGMFLPLVAAGRRIGRMVFLAAVIPKLGTSLLEQSSSVAVCRHLFRCERHNKRIEFARVGRPTRKTPSAFARGSFASLDARTGCRDILRQ